MFKKRLILTVIALVILVIVIQTKQRTSNNPYLNANTQVKTYEGETGWGYDIYVDGVLLIHQPNIPALPGNRGFTIEADAQRVAKLIVGKIKGNIMPPALTLEDLKAVGIK